MRADRLLGAAIAFVTCVAFLAGCADPQAQAQRQFQSVAQGVLVSDAIHNDHENRIEAYRRNEGLTAARSACLAATAKSLAEDMLQADNAGKDVYADVEENATMRANAKCEEMGVAVRFRYVYPAAWTGTAATVSAAEETAFNQLRSAKTDDEYLTQPSDAIFRDQNSKWAIGSKRWDYFSVGIHKKDLDSGNVRIYLVQVYGETYEADKNNVLPGDLWWYLAKEKFMAFRSRYPTNADDYLATSKTFMSARPLDHDQTPVTPAAVIRTTRSVGFAKTPVDLSKDPDCQPSEQALETMQNTAYTGKFKAFMFDPETDYCHTRKVEKNNIAPWLDGENCQNPTASSNGCSLAQFVSRTSVDGNPVISLNHPGSGLSSRRKAWLLSNATSEWENGNLEQMYDSPDHCGATNTCNSDYVIRFEYPARAMRKAHGFVGPFQDRAMHQYIWMNRKASIAAHDVAQAQIDQGTRTRHPLLLPKGYRVMGALSTVKGSFENGTAGYYSAAELCLRTMAVVAKSRSNAGDLSDVDGFWLNMPWVDPPNSEARQAETARIANDYFRMLRRGYCTWSI